MIELNRLACESAEREKTLAKLEAEVTTAMETERRPEIKEAPDDSRHERKIYTLRRV